VTVLSVWDASGRTRAPPALHLRLQVQHGGLADIRARMCGHRNQSRSRRPWIAKHAPANLATAGYAAQRSRHAAPSATVRIMNDRRENPDGRIEHLVQRWSLEGARILRMEPRPRPSSPADGRTRAWRPCLHRSIQSCRGSLSATDPIATRRTTAPRPWHPATMMRMQRGA
jgi:hypothetical protein